MSPRTPSVESRSPKHGGTGKATDGVHCVHPILHGLIHFTGLLPAWVMMFEKIAITHGK